MPAFLSASPIVSTFGTSCLASSHLNLRNACHTQPPRVRKPAPARLTMEADVHHPESAQCDLRLASPGKINLFLRITRKRPDGFHELASLFQSISLHDTLHFTLKTGTDPDAIIDTLECDTPGVPTDSSNLVLKALAKFRERTGTSVYFHVRLDKRIPHEAGLGGGSSNAATALWAANELTGRPATPAMLAEFGAEFGSDISFFLSSGTAYCTGRGEIIEDIPYLGDRNLYIVKPAEGLSTGLVFKNFDIDSCSTDDPRELLSSIQRDMDTAHFVNDLERPSFMIMPRLQHLKESLHREGFKVVLMSGSGTSFFCLGEPRNKQQFMSAFAKDNDVRIFEATFHSRASSDVWYFEQAPAAMTS